MSNCVHTECSIHLDNHVCYSWIYIIDIVQWQRWPETVIISRQIWQRKYLLILSLTRAGKTCVQRCFPLLVFKMKLQYWYGGKKSNLWKVFLVFKFWVELAFSHEVNDSVPRRAVSTIILAVQTMGWNHSSWDPILRDRTWAYTCHGK